MFSHSSASPSLASPALQHRRWSWLREPLLHFFVLGAALFAADAALRPVDEGHVIVVGPEVDAEAIQLFAHTNGRPPDAKELRALHQVWLDNEVLYREGLAMQLDRGDPAIRERVIFKALSVIDANVEVQAPADEVLEQWFEAHRDKYDEPARYDFEEAALSHAGASEQEIRSFVEQLNRGAPGDAQAGLRVFKGRPYPNLVQSYGEDFARHLAGLPAGQWQAMQTRDGWRAVRLDARTQHQPADFTALRNVVLQDWRDEAAAQARTAAVRDMAKKYQIRLPTPQPKLG